MSLSWHQRKARLALLLKTAEDEDAEAEALDRLMHGQSVIGKTAKTAEVDKLRFSDGDLKVVGTLEYGQFGVIDVVTCRMNNSVYVRKTIEKKFALRTRDQCSPQFERDLLLAARRTGTPWAPQLLCAFQSPTHLSIVMDYAAGGNLWDVLESSPHGGRILESDLHWWAPQIVSAIHWCHLQGFAHRDIKPHNFVLTPTAHLQLIDFGSAAPLLSPSEDGSQTIPRRYCLVPCGTCDYVSPEILQVHEAALVALDMSDEDDQARTDEKNGYGMETDWWSMGVMLYEMAYGVAPFFANDIRQTYARIVNHEKSLKFDKSISISHEYQHFIRRLLTRAQARLGRRNVMEITDHPLFANVDWATLPTQPAPADLHLPQFVYNEPKDSPPGGDNRGNHENDDSLSQGFAFSVFFQQSSYAASGGISVLRPSPGPGAEDTPTNATGDGILSSNILSISIANKSDSAASFIGFSWGPPIDAFPEEGTGDLPGDTSQELVEQILNKSTLNRSAAPAQNFTPRPLMRTPLPAWTQQRGTPLPQHNRSLSVPAAAAWGRTPLRGIFTHLGGAQTINGFPHTYSTPMRPYALSPSAFGTLQRTGGTVRRTVGKRPVSDREAMKQLVDCVGMSARKKVLESGRKPRILEVFSVKRRGAPALGNLSRTSIAEAAGGVTGEKPKVGAAGTRGGSGTGPGMTSKKELRFDRFATPIPAPDYSGASSTARSQSLAAGAGLTIGDDSSIYYHPSRELAVPPGTSQQVATAFGPSGETDTETEATDSEFGGADPPPSPSPSPRPGSAMSMMSMTMMSRRSGSQTPTISGHFGSFFSGGNERMRPRSGSGSALAGTSMGRSSSNVMGALPGPGLLTVPSMTGINTRFMALPVVDIAETAPGAGELLDHHSTSSSVAWLPDGKKFQALPHAPAQAPVPLPTSLGAASSNGAGAPIGPQSEMRREVTEGIRSPPVSTMTDQQVNPGRPTEASSLQDLEHRHHLLMRDIEDLEDRFDDIAASFIGSEE
ncbi:hypothetical protein D9619_010214 [Psilocybe cf. subviscida]|uniref:non-specific serine/threonine protein kinase n=1 Tax=Psilocybe cf. subviscida TaxID=2480587 RepID=A0A8H5ASN8_9AGAR|nr:hypothetical protein D9619_010214 [Psilocybe cf. subviscida]